MAILRPELPKHDHNYDTEGRARGGPAREAQSIPTMPRACAAPGSSHVARRGRSRTRPRQTTDPQDAKYQSTDSCLPSDTFASRLLLDCRSESRPDSAPPSSSIEERRARKATRFSVHPSNGRDFSEKDTCLAANGGKPMYDAYAEVITKTRSVGDASTRQDLKHQRFTFQ